VNAERFITPELKEMENTILGAQERCVELEYELFLELRQKVVDATETIQGALAKDRLDQGVYYINRLIPTARLMQHRALAHFGMSEAPGELPEEMKEMPAPKKETPVSAGPAASRVVRSIGDDGVGEALDEILQSPLNAFGEDFSRLLSRKLFTEEDILKGFREKGQVFGLEAYRETTLELCHIEKLKHKSLKDRIRKIPGLTERVIHLANTADENIHDLEKAMEKMGLPYAAATHAVFSWMQGAKQDRNPLNLEPLAKHTLAVAFLSRELSLKFNEPHSFTASGTLHNAGKWFLAFRYPAFFGISLTLGKNDIALLRNAQESIFGTTDIEIAVALLKEWEYPKAYADVIRYHGSPTEASKGSGRIVASIVNLANHLAKISRIGYSGTQLVGGEDAFIESPAWEALKREGVEIPLEPKDYLSALKVVTDKVKRQIKAVFD